MAWFKGDDKLPRNPKMLASDLEVCWYYVCALAHCAESLTDGFIADSAVTLIAPHIEAPRMVAERCTAVQLFQRVQDGYLIPDYLDMNPSREQTVAKREADRVRQNKHRQSLSDSQRDSTEPSGVSSDVPSRPVPKGQNTPSSSVTETEPPELTEDDERAISAVLEAIADHKQQQANGSVRNVKSWRRSVIANARGEHLEALVPLVREFVSAPPTMLAAKVLGEPTPYLSNYREPM
jgi:hypothetical protein